MSSAGPQQRNPGPAKTRLAGRLSVETIFIIVVAVAALIWAGLWAKAMVTPVYRVGNPPLAAPASASATPATPRPSTSATPTPPSSKASTMKSSGKFALATVSVSPTSSTGSLRRYVVQTETSSGLSPNATARQIADILNDPRSWSGSGNLRFALISDASKADFVITVSSPGTAAKSCSVVGGVCRSGKQIIVDALSWKNTASTYGSDAAGWQSYLTNRGVGIWLGAKTAACAGSNKLAPLMMDQQVNLNGCVANPWPRP